MERILEKFVALVGTKMWWLEKLVSHHVDTMVEMYHPGLVKLLTDDLKDGVRGYVYSVLQLQHLTRTPGQERASNDSADRLGGHEPDYPSQTFYHAPGSMSLVSRIMTRTFWRALTEAKFPEFMFANYSSPVYNTIRDLAPHLPCFKSQGDARIRYVSQATAIATVRGFASEINFRRCGGAEFDKPISGLHFSSYFNLWAFQADVQQYIETVARKIQAPLSSLPDGASVGMVQFEMVDTLLCLEEEEFKYLPLWAGGNDDGTGGVFALDQDVPMLETGGFSRPGPAVHTGSSDGADSASTADSFSTIHPSEAASTMQRASHQATASHDAETIASASTDSGLWHRVSDLDLNESDLMEMDEEDVNTDIHDDNASNPSVTSSGTIGADSQNQLDLDDDDNDDDDDDDYEHLDLDVASDETNKNNAST